jgi:hypothetical protein
VKHVVGIAVLLAVLSVVWQIGAAEVHNIELQDDLKDLTAQLGTKTGLKAPPTDEELRAFVTGKADHYGIELTPQQVTVRRWGNPEFPSFDLSADYTVSVNLLVYKYSLHFTPSSSGGRF